LFKTFPDYKCVIGCTYISTLNYAPVIYIYLTWFLHLTIVCNVFSENVISFFSRTLSLENLKWAR
jgi:hypothetical protein